LRWQNPNPPKKIKREQVHIARYNMRRAAAYRDPRIDIRPIRLASEGGEKCPNILVIEIVGTFFLLGTATSSESTANESRTVPFCSAKSRALRGFETGRSRALTKTFVSKTHRNAVMRLSAKNPAFLG
jgi:hypothetical protein